MSRILFELNRSLHTYYTQNPVAPRRRSRSCKFALKPSAPTPSEESVCSRSSLSFPLPLRIYQAISFFDFTYFICLRWIVEWLWSLKFPSARELLEEIRTTFWSIFKGGPRLFFRKCPYRRALFHHLGKISQCIEISTAAIMAKVCEYCLS